MVLNRRLYFTNVGRLPDPFEGEPSDLYLEQIRIYFMTYSDNDYQEQFQREVDVLHRRHDSTFVNCWRIGDYDSEAMWQLYCGSDAGVAIKTTEKALLDHFVNQSTERIVHSPVEYIDHSKVNQSLGLADNLYFFKRKSFEHESEYRFLIELSEPAPKREGLHVDFAVPDEEIEILINPSAPRWYAEVIIDMIAAMGRSFQKVSHNPVQSIRSLYSKRDASNMRMESNG